MSSLVCKMDNISNESLTRKSALNGIEECRCKAKAEIDSNNNVTNVTSTRRRYKETLLLVPEKLASMSLGFAIDSGGSVTKIVYRSKEDYRNGQRTHINNDNDHNVEEDCRGVLRLLHYPKADLAGLPEFLDQNCDIMESSRSKIRHSGSENGFESQKSGTENGTRASEDLPVWYQTGLGVQHYMTELDSKLGIRTQLTSELDSLCKALIQLCEHNTSNSKSAPPILHTQSVSALSLDRALVQIRAYIQMMQTFEDVAGNMNLATSKEGFDVLGWSTKLMTGTGESLRDEFSVPNIECPQMVVLIGSALAAMILHEDGSTRYTGMSPAAGKTVLGLGLALTGAKNFDELLEMANRGNRFAADLLMSELSNKDRDHSGDFYSAVSAGSEVPIFLLGKLSEERYKGSYTVEDLAVGVLKIFCVIFCKICLAWAQLYQKDSIIFVGSFLSHPLIRDLFEECFYADSLLQPFYGNDVVRMAVIENSGHLCALGTWLTNWELEGNPSSGSAVRDKSQSDYNN